MYLIENIRDGKPVYEAGVDMALQNYIQNNIFLDGDILFPYLSEPKVQIGRYQNTLKEINQDYLKEKNIKVSRRDTGGGAIYVDYGSPSFCFLIDGDTNLFGNYNRFYEPVIKALNALGVDEVKQSGRNDLEIDGKKISGAAMTLKNNRLYGGFSLLLDVDYEAMTNALNPNRKKIESKGIESVRSRVTGLREYLAPEYANATPEEFKDLIVKHLLGIGDLSEAKRYILTEEDWAAVDKLCEEKYLNWEWIYGHNPQFELTRTERLSSGTVEVTLSVEKGRIKECKFYGDFFGRYDIKDVEDALLGTRFEKEDILAVLNQLELSNYFGTIEADEIATLMLS